jgi:hypothetical protein
VAALVLTLAFIPTETQLPMRLLKIDKKKKKRVKIEDKHKVTPFTRMIFDDCKNRYYLHWTLVLHHHACSLGHGCLHNNCDRLLKCFQPAKGFIYDLSKKNR